MFKLRVLTSVAAFTGIMLSSAASASVTNHLPYGCNYGKINNSSVEISAIPNAIETGFETYYNPYSGSHWWDFFRALQNLSSSSSLAAQGPDYVLKGTSNRFKGDLEFLNLEDKLRDVNFYSSEQGFVGQDRSNWDSNAYKHITFNATYGAGLVWVTSAGRCAAKSVWVQQDKPKFIYKSAPYSRYDNNVTVNVGWLVDKYSKAGVEGASSGARVYVNAVGAEGIGAGASRAIATLSGSTTISFQSSQAGLHTVTVEVTDGTFSSGKVYIGRVDVGGEKLDRPCPTCPPY